MRPTPGIINNDPTRFGLAVSRSEYGFNVIAVADRERFDDIAICRDECSHTRCFKPDLPGASRGSGEAEP